MQILFLGVHTGEDTFKCKECTNIGFKSYEHLRLHNLKVHKGVKFICDICGKEFSFKDQVKRHVEGVHNKEKNFKCHLCTKVVTRLDHLQNHLLKTHKIKHTMDELREMSHYQIT